MSATEIITVIKAINDHVTIKYCNLIIDYLAEKRKANLLFERAFFNEMDKSVQQLINNILCLFNSTQPKNELLQKIQAQCTEYNTWKKNKYDNHLSKIVQLKNDLDLFIRKTLNEKLMEQKNLFDEGLSTPLNQQSGNQTSFQENKKMQQQYINNNLDDNITNSTTLSNSSPNTSDNKSIQQMDTNTCNVSITIPNNINEVNAVNFPVFLQTQINTQLRAKNPLSPKINNNQTPPPISFSSIKNNSNKIATNNSKLNNIPPPKPKPPKPAIQNTNCYNCHLCNHQFTARLGWESHLLTHQFSNRIKKNREQKKIVSKIVSKTKPKRKKKRDFRKLNSDIDDKINITHKSNKRSCHRYQCEYCDKVYSRQATYIKHYNNHMITNENIQCNFCLNNFKGKQRLKQHINKFNAGIALDDGFYQCCQCTMRFESRNEITTHISHRHKMYSEGNRS